jgi:putative endonuclease
MGENIMKKPVVYLMARKRNGTLYVGVTSDLSKCCWQHKTGCLEGFTRKYHIHLLVYYKVHNSMRMAILREKQIKKWNRAWKVRLIEKENPCWEDLFDMILCPQKNLESGFPPKPRGNDSSL